MKDRVTFQLKGKITQAFMKITFNFLATIFGGLFISLAIPKAFAQNTQSDRALWASINGKSNASLGTYAQYTGKVLVSWRMLPGDDENTGFDLYRAATEGGVETKIASNIKNRTCFVDTGANKQGDNYYRLTPAGKNEETLATYKLPKAQVSAGLPYVSIPLKTTEDVCDAADISYQANDCSVGDLDGDGQMEIVVKRLLTVFGSDGNIISDGTGAGASDRRARHTVIWDAYKLDGTFLWRVMSGPNIILGNSSNFAVADLDGDGRCEFVTKTGEGTVFGDGAEIGDTDSDGRTDYRDIWPGHYTGDSDKGYGGPEFFSVVDGATGKELARADFIARGTAGKTWKANSESWGDNYWKRANSLRLGAASFDGEKMQIFLGRGVYGRTVTEAWEYADGNLTKLWHFDTSAAGGKDNNKDGKNNSAYAAQGNHSFNVADLDGDGYDEVMYGSMAIDHDGYGLWTTGLGHGDANHVGKFLPEREGLQMYHCLESGKTMVALHDTRDGSIIWSKVASENNDMGRCLVGDFFPQYPGCEFFYYQGNYIQQDGTETTINTKGQKGGCGMAIWFDGFLSRQLIEENIVSSPANGRTFTMYRYDESFNNGTKSNPGWIGDFLGDWREEIIVPDATKLKDIKVFTTWYPTTHKFPWLMTDHTYLMSCINQNVGYNQPTNLGYYLGTDLKTDREAWDAAGYTSGIRMIETDSNNINDDSWFNVIGQKVKNPQHGIYIRNGRKYVVK